MSDKYDKQEYLGSLVDAKHAEAVNVRGGLPSSTALRYVWTHRMTGADVISMVTTCRPISKSGSTTSTKKLANVGTVSPLEVGASNVTLMKRRVNHRLWAEHEEFMRGLQERRDDREASENAAAKRIQSLFRGYWTRCCLEVWGERAAVGRAVRSSLQDVMYSRCQTDGWVLTAGQHKYREGERRRNAALVMQCACRQFMARRKVRRKRRTVRIQHIHRSATRIQSLVRARMAREFVMRERDRHLVEQKRRAAILIQTVFRCYRARRSVGLRRYRFQMLAARSIQCAYRIRAAKVRIRERRRFLYHQRRENGAIALQTLIRGMLGRLRVSRLLKRRKDTVRHNGAAALQRLVRGMQARQYAAWKRRTLQHFKEENANLFASVDSDNGDDDNDPDHGGDGQTATADMNHPLYRDPIQVNKANENGDTMVTIAAKRGHLPMVFKALSLGFDIAHCNNTRQDALTLAISEEHSDMTEYLCTKMNDGKAAGSVSICEAIVHNGGQWLCCAVENGDNMLVQKLLDLGSDINSASHVCGECPLHVACRMSDMELFDLLLARGATITQKDAKGRSVLHSAAEGGSVDIVTKAHTLLSEANEASPTTLTDSTGKTPVTVGLMFNNREAVDLLLELREDGGSEGDIDWNAEDMDTVVELAAEGNLSTLQLLVDNHQLDLSSEDSQGRTLATVAARHNRVPMLRYLADKLVDFVTPTSTGWSVLQEATAHEQMFDHVLRQARYGFSVEHLALPDADHGASPIHKAAINDTNLYSVLKEFMRANEELGPRDNPDVLSLAPSMVKALVNLRDVDGLTPLMYAVLSCNVAAAKGLLNLGAAPDLVDDTGRTVLSYLCAYLCGRGAARVRRKRWDRLQPFKVQPYKDLPFGVQEDLLKLATTLASGGLDLPRTSTLPVLPLQETSDVLGFVDEGSSGCDGGENAVALRVLAPEVLTAESLAHRITPPDARGLSKQVIVIPSSASTVQLVEQVGATPPRTASSRCPLAMVVAMGDEHAHIVRALLRGFPDDKRKLGTGACAIAWNSTRVLGAVLDALLADDCGDDPKDAVSALPYYDVPLIGWAILYRNLPLLRFMVNDYGLTPWTNRFGPRMNSALHISACYGTEEITRELLSTFQGGNVDTQNYDGRTPLQVAILSKRYDNARALIEFGANAAESLYVRYTAWLLSECRRQNRQQAEVAAAAAQAAANRKKGRKKNKKNGR